MKFAKINKNYNFSLQTSMNGQPSLSIIVYLSENTEHIYEAKTMLLKDLNWVNLTSYSPDQWVITPAYAVIKLKLSTSLTSIKSNFITLSIQDLNSLKTQKKNEAAAYA